MSVASPSRIPWARIALWAGFPLVAAIEFLYLSILPDTVTWEAATGALVIAALTVGPVALSRAFGRQWLWAGLALVLLIHVPLSFIQGLETCRQCGTTRRYAELGWGIGRAWIHFPLGESTRPTQALADFFGGGHEHTWNFNWEHMDGAFLFNMIVTGGYRSCGSGHINRLGIRYEQDAAFRSLLRERVRAGEVSEDQVRLLLGLSMDFHRHASVPPGTHALVKKAGEWMEEYFWFPALEKDWPPEVASSK